MSEPVLDPNLRYGECSMLGLIRQGGLTWSNFWLKHQTDPPSEINNKFINAWDEIAILVNETLAEK